MIDPPKDLHRFESLLEIVAALRGPGGCPWDLEQTHRTLAPFAIEEAHELAEAIENGTKTHIVEELGDVLLQVVLNAEIARQNGDFAIADVIEAIAQKMLRRHPHVFTAGASDLGLPEARLAKNSDEVLKNWADIKRAEKRARGTEVASGFDVPLALPALSRAQKIGAKTKDVRFDWPDWTGAFGKIDEEVDELRIACTTGTRTEQEHELGDLLFSAAQLARHLDIEPEQALRSANARFERRYLSMRSLAEAAGRDFSKMSTEEMETFWEKAKAAV